MGAVWVGVGQGLAGTAWRGWVRGVSPTLPRDLEDHSRSWSGNRDPAAPGAAHNRSQAPCLQPRTERDHACFAAGDLNGPRSPGELAAELALNQDAWALRAPAGWASTRSPLPLTPGPPRSPSHPTAPAGCHLCPPHPPKCHFGDPGRLRGLKGKKPDKPGPKASWPQGEERPGQPQALLLCAMAAHARLAG